MGRLERAAIHAAAHADYAARMAHEAAGGGTRVYRAAASAVAASASATAKAADIARHAFLGCDCRRRRHEGRRAPALRDLAAAKVSA